METEVSLEFLNFYTFWNTKSKPTNEYKSLEDVKSLMFKVDKSKFEWKRSRRHL